MSYCCEKMTQGEECYCSKTREDLVRIVDSLRRYVGQPPADSLGALYELATGWADEGKSRSGIQTSAHKTLWRCAAELRQALDGTGRAKGGEP